MKRVLLCLLLLAAAVPARAQSVLDTILARGTLRVGLTGDYRPFSIKDASGKFTGMDVDMAEALAKAMGVKLEIVPTAWPALMADLQDRKYDIGMGGITVTLERAKTAMFSTPVLRTGKAPIARCTDKDHYTSLREIDRPGVKVATNPGGTNERFDRANLHQAEIVVFPNNAAIFDELIAKHADVMITDSVEARLQQKLHPELCAINPNAPFDVSELAYLLPRDEPLKMFVDLWLRMQTESGEVRQLQAKYLE
jgi:cyclohexadienyl dehydratase